MNSSAIFLLLSTPIGSNIDNTKQEYGFQYGIASKDFFAAKNKIRN